MQKKSLDVKCSMSRRKSLSIANSGKVNHFRLLSYANFMSFHPDTLKMGLYQSQSQFEVALELLFTQNI